MLPCAVSRERHYCQIKEHGYVLTPGRYVGAAEVEDDGIPFEEKMSELTATLSE